MSTGPRGGGTVRRVRLSPRDRLIFALDVDELDVAHRLVRELAPAVATFKVGPVLFTRHGPEVVQLVRDHGASVFLDLKFHDIPETVAGATREAMRLGVRMLTVHALGGHTMIGRAAAELSRLTVVPGVPRPLVLAVTILTSHTEADLHALGLAGPIPPHSVRLAQLALSAGAGGLVASAHELSHLRAVLPPDTVYVCPGIRGVDDAKGDQARVMGPREAIQAGATYLVVGRPIRDASSPADAAQRFLDAIAGAV